MKEKLKKIKVLRYLHGIIKDGDFREDKRFFLKHCGSNMETFKQIDYVLMLDVHTLEKGMACKKLRPFGVQKVERIMALLEKYPEELMADSFACGMAVGILKQYIKVYEEMGWSDRDEYQKVKAFLQNNALKVRDVKVGAFDLDLSGIKGKNNIDYDKFLASRHSVRNYSNKPLSSVDIEKAVKMAIKTPSACNRQMCKIYYAKSKDARKVIEKYAQGFGLFELDNANYFVVTFDISANFSSGERNQGWFNAGLISMNFTNALHSLGIGSCFCQFGNSFKQEKEFKAALDVPESERIAVLIAAGYYDKVSRIPYSARKDVTDVFAER